MADDEFLLLTPAGYGWGAYPLKPSESRSIATADAWLVKRKWKAWC
jgi:hypothetical protein